MQRAGLYDPPRPDRADPPGPEPGTHCLGVDLALVIVRWGRLPSPIRPVGAANVKLGRQAARTLIDRRRTPSNPFTGTTPGGALAHLPPPKRREDTINMTFVVLIAIFVSRAASTPLEVTETDRSIVSHLLRGAWQRSDSLVTVELRKSPDSPVPSCVALFIQLRTHLICLRILGIVVPYRAWSWSAENPPRVF